MRLLDTCPMCHEDLPESIDKDLIEAKAFCPWCDYPLFWTVQLPDVPAAPANDAEIHATPATPQALERANGPQYCSLGRRPRNWFPADIVEGPTARDIVRSALISRAIGPWDRLGIDSWGVAPGYYMPGLWP